MKIINVNVDNIIRFKNIYDTDTQATININTDLEIPSGNVKSVVFNFDFISPQANQSDLELFGVFISNKLDKPVLVKIGKVVADDELYETACFVPHEILDEESKILFGIYGFIGSGDNLEKRLSLGLVPFEVVAGSYREDGIETITPTPSVFEVYFKNVKKANEKLDEKLILFKKNEENYTLNSGDTELILKIEDFSRLFNVFVDINGLTLAENVDYTIDYVNGKIILNEAIKTNNTIVHIIWFVSTIVNMDDFDIIKNGADLNNTIQELQEEVSRLRNDIEAISISGAAER